MKTGALFLDEGPSVTRARGAEREEEADAGWEETAYGSPTTGEEPV